MPKSNNLQNVPGVVKSTQQRYASARVVHHIRFDGPTQNALRQALDILAGPDQVSIGLLVRRAIALYGASLTGNLRRVEVERVAVRNGARKVKASQ